MRFPIIWRFNTILTKIGAVALIAPFLYLLVSGASSLTVMLPQFIGLSGETLSLLILTLSFTLILAYVNAAYLYTQKNPAVKLLLLLLPLSYPTYVMAFNWAMVWEYMANIFPFVSRSSIKSMIGLAFVLSLCLYPYVLLPLHLFASKKINQIFAQSKALNQSLRKTLLRVILPLSFPAALLGLSLVAYELLNDYGAAKYYGIQTLTTSIFKQWFGKGSRDEALALALILLLIVLIFRALSSRTRKKLDTDSVGKNYPKIQLNSITIIAGLKVFFMVTVVCALVLPLLGSFYGLYFDWEKHNFEVLLSSGLNSMMVAFFTTLFTILLIMGVKFGSKIMGDNTLPALHNILSSGYSIPGAVIASALMGFIWLGMDQLYEWAPQTTQFLYQSILLLVFGMAFKLYAAGVPAAENGWNAFGKTQIRAIRTFLPFKKFPITTRIIKPQLLPYYLAGALFIFIDALKELPLTLILRPFNFDTLATKAYNYVEDEYLFRAAPYSILITLFCALGIVIYHRLNQRDSA